MELFSYLLKLNNYFLYKVAFWTPVLKHIWCLQTITVSTLVDIWISTSLDTRSLFKLALSPSALTLVVSDSSVHGSCLQWQGVSQLSATLLTQAARIRHHSKNACVCLLLLGRKSHLLRTIWAPGTLTTVGLVIILIFSVVRTRIYTHIYFQEKTSHEFTIILSIQFQNVRILTYLCLSYTCISRLLPEKLVFDITREGN